LIDRILLPKIRQTIPNKIAEEICSVEPIKIFSFKELIDNAMSKQNLINSGYKPVSELGLMWIKNDE
jgi:hypothetical protein